MVDPSFHLGKGWFATRADAGGVVHGPPHHIFAAAAGATLVRPHADAVAQVTFGDAAAVGIVRDAILAEFAAVVIGDHGDRGTGTVPVAVWVAAAGCAVAHDQVAVGFVGRIPAVDAEFGVTVEAEHARVFVLKLWPHAKDTQCVGGGGFDGHRDHCHRNGDGPFTLAAVCLDTLTAHKVGARHFDGCGQFGGVGGFVDFEIKAGRGESQLFGHLETIPSGLGDIRPAEDDIAGEGHRAVEGGTEVGRRGAIDGTGRLFAGFVDGPLFGAVAVEEGIATE